MAPQDDKEEYRGDNSSLWRTLTIAMLTALAAVSGTVFTLGLGNVKHYELEAMEKKIYAAIDADFTVRDLVKHSELDQIMATRAPYIHDKQRIDDHFTNNDAQNKALAERITKLEELARDDFDKRIRELEQRHK